jgi:hypothetical protein
MKKFLVIFTSGLIFSVAIAADVCVKIEEHRDEFYDGGRVIPGEDSVQESWMGDNRYALVDDDVKFLIDLEAKKMTIVNEGKGFYAETSLPLDLSKLLDPQFLARVQMFPTTGTVTKSEETKKIGEWPCQKYVVETWIEYEGAKYNETVRHMWVTKEVPFDLEKYMAIRADGYRLNNYGEKLVEALLAVDGYQIMAESITYSRGEERKSSQKVVDMSEKETPEALYKIPEGLDKKEKLSQGDFS